MVGGKGCGRTPIIIMIIIIIIIYYYYYYYFEGAFKGYYSEEKVFYKGVHQAWLKRLNFLRESSQ